MGQVRDDQSLETSKDVGVPPVLPGGYPGARSERSEAIRSLLFDQNEASSTLALLRAFSEEMPVATARASVYAYLLNHHAAEVREVVGAELSRLQPNLPQLDLMPILFSAWKREPNEGARRTLGISLQAYPSERLGSLERYFETLSFSVYAKGADLRPRSSRGELAPDQFERALIVLHLDHSSDARQVATAVLCTRFNHLNPEQRHTLSLSLVYALSDPRIFSEYVVSNLLYMTEQSGKVEASTFLPLIRRLHESENPSIRADAALVGLCLGEFDEALARVVVMSISEASTFASPVEVPEVDPPAFPRIDANLDLLGQWVEEVAGRSADSDEIHELLNDLHGAYRQACSDVISTFNARVDLLYQRLRRLSSRPDELSRELFILRAAARLDRLPEPARCEVVEALLGVMENKREDIRVRKAVISRIVYNRENRDLIVARVGDIASDSSQPGELRIFAAKSLAGM